jgi:hypothetical protein
VITERNRAAGLAIEARQPERALALFRDAEMLAPNTRSAFGIVGALYQLQRWDSLLTTTARYLSDTNRAFSLLPMLLWHGVAQWKSGDSAEADRSLTRLIVENLPGWPTPYAERMRRALRRGGTDSLKRLVTGTLRWDARESDSLRLLRFGELLVRYPEDPVVVEEYMRAAAVDDNGRKRALNAWRRIEGVPAPDELRLFAVRLYYQEGEWTEAQRLLRHLLNEPLSASVRSDVTEWLARCAWQLRRMKN